MTKVETKQMNGRTMTWLMTPAVLALVGMALATPVLAHDEDADEVGQAAGPNQGNVSLESGVEFTNAYYFRGIIQENQGFITQPYATVSFALFEGDGDGLINSLGLFMGIWNSFHDGPSGSGGPNTDPKSWYESDLYTGVTVGLPANFEGTFTYTWYTSPNDVFLTVHEAMIGLNYDDSELWTFVGLDGMALSPSISVAFETQNTAFGPDEGVYLELGIEPSVNPFTNGPINQLSVSFPVTLGLGLSDYYELVTVNPDLTTSRADDEFGYLKAGVAAALPLPIPAEFGSWTLSAGVHLLFLGDNLEAANAGDDFEVIGVIGISMEY